MRKVLVITDNPMLASGVQLMMNKLDLECLVEFRCSIGSEESISEAIGQPVRPLDIKREFKTDINGRFDLVISAHCKQLFPTEMVNAVRCVNVHPGFNPYNRGWFPQVFSIINGLPMGVTIHEIDNELDHGEIIVQEQITANSWETSLDIYNRIIQKELELLDSHLTNIIEGDYKTSVPSGEGNLNLKKDFQNLCQLDLDKTQTVRETIDLLRALSHGSYNNGYFIDKESGKKVYVKISLQPE